ncbi:MAG: BMP family ABC transporter substrate-binding protein [Oscillospiraceae bacterium]
MTSSKINWLKRIAAIMMAMSLTFCLAGCEKDAGGSGSSDSSSIDEPEKPHHKVGYIFHDEVDDFGFSYDMNTQRLLAANRSNAETCYIDNVSITDFEKAVKTLVEAGCTDIVSGSAVFSSMLNTISNRYMDINFIGYGMVSGGSNVSTYTELPYQGAYAGGIAAAYNSYSRKIGFVGDQDLLYLIPVVNAAALGTQAVFNTAKLFTITASRDKEIEKAIDALIARGCDVIICYTASSHAEEYCEAKGIKFVGSHDFNEKENDYTKMLMYFYTRRDSYFLAQFKQMQLDTWQPDVYTGNMGNGIICISEALSANKDNDCQRVLDALVPMLANGGEIFSGQLVDNTGVPRYLQTDVMTDRQIFAMDWFVQGVEIVGNYREPQLTIPENPMEIQY